MRKKFKMGVENRKIICQLPNFFMVGLRLLFFLVGGRKEKKGNAWPKLKVE